MRYLLTALSLILWAAMPASAQLFKLGSGNPKDYPFTQPTTLPSTAPATAPAGTQPATQGVGPYTFGEKKENPNDKPVVVEQPGNKVTPAEKPEAPEKVATTDTATRPTTKRTLDPVLPPGATAKSSHPTDDTPATKPAKGDKVVTLPEFPPGLFTDGNTYRINDLRGKVVVLFFFDAGDERVLATIPHRNALIKKFRDKPVVFLGIENDTIQNARNNARYLGLAMPVFADTLGVMMSRYHVRMNTSVSWNVCIIDPAGKMSHEEMTEASIEKALADAKWKYRDQQTFDPRLSVVLDAFEFGDYERGMKQLTGMAGSADKRVADSARVLMGILRTEAEGLKSKAEAAAVKDPIAAYDCYARIMATCPGSDLARSVLEPMKKLEKHREVKPEVAARDMYKVLCQAIARDESVEKWDAVGYCEEIIRVAPGTPTADKLVSYLEDLGKVRERGVYGPRQFRRRG